MSQQKATMIKRLKITKPFSVVRCCGYRDHVTHCRRTTAMLPAYFQEKVQQSKENCRFSLKRANY